MRRQDGRDSEDEAGRPDGCGLDARIDGRRDLHGHPRRHQDRRHARVQPEADRPSDLGCRELPAQHRTKESRVGRIVRWVGYGRSVRRDLPDVRIPRDLPALRDPTDPMKIVVADDLPQSALDLLRAEPGWVVDARPGRTPAALATDLADADALLVRSATKV